MQPSGSRGSFNNKKSEPAFSRKQVSDERVHRVMNECTTTTRNTLPKQLIRLNLQSSVMKATYTGIAPLFVKIGARAINTMTFVAFAPAAAQPFAVAFVCYLS
jgi:hypothetical protein